LENSAGYGENLEIIRCLVGNQCNWWRVFAEEQKSLLMLTWPT